MKKTLTFSIIFFLLSIIGLSFYIYRHLPIINGYAAKMACSCVFVANRSLADVVNDDLDMEMINLAKVEVDEMNQTVTASTFGFAPSTAVYRNGLGCTLATDKVSVADLKKIENKPIKILPERPDTLPFPLGEIVADSSKNLINQQVIEEAVQPFFNAKDSSKTKAIVIIKDGQLVFEKYADGIDKDTPLLSWSMAKSLTNALVGRMVMKGQLKVNDPVALPHWASDERSKITLHHLLQMSSGLDWDERYDGISDATNMLYVSDDFGDFASQVTVRNKPDEEWYYSSGTSNIISGYLRMQFADYQEYIQFPRKELFNKIGATSAVFEPDASGTFVGSSYCFATARDWARFGMLFLQDGVWNGERILPEGWVEYSTTPAINSAGIYGAHIWLNAGNSFPSAPSNMYHFSGFQDQFVFIFPTENMVVVRLGTAMDEIFPADLFLKQVLSSL